MTNGGNDTRGLDGVLDTFASRVGIFAVVGLLIAVCIGAGFYVQTVVAQLEENHTTFRDRQARNGYVAMSDIQRLLLVAQRAVDAGGMTPRLEKEFRNAADALYVRTDIFYRSMTDLTSMESGVASVKALEKIIQTADRAVDQGFPDNRILVGDLLKHSTEARSKLVQFLDDMRREADDILETQSRAVRKQQVVVLGNIAVLTLVSSVALLLLRREVLGRRARQRAERRVEFLAFYDQLTELPNRAQFQDRLQSLLDAGHPLALVYADLDDFKIINDTYGHVAGDAALRHVGGLLEKAAAKHDGFAARLGGDEFALVIPSDDLDQLTAICNRIFDTTSKPFTFEGEAFEVGLSIGLATTTQVSLKMSATLDMLSRVTDFALYASKAAGRRRFTIYDQELEKRFKERRAMLEELPDAIENGDLEAHLQPKVHLADGTVFGFEALVRWRRNGQLVPPDQFIFIAEESGLVVDIDHFVLKRAAQLIARWNHENASRYSVSVNLSAVHFNSQRIIEWVQDALWVSRLTPELLTLEITETVEMRDWTQASRVIAGLRKLGVRIAIDDFGTGFSSLAYLRATEADELKIDRSLVEEIESSEKARLLLSSVLDIARNLELDVIVEGIETRAQAQILHKMGALSGQGFYFGRPETPETALTAAATAEPGARTRAS